MIDALGLYIFTGGFSLGMRAAGLNVVGQLEHGDFGIATFKNLFPKVPVYTDKHTWPLQRFAGVPFVYANPPCAIWSMAGASMHQGKTNWLRDPRASCIKDVMDVLRCLRPKVLMWESVTQAWLRGREWMRKLEREGRAMGYHVTYLFTSAELHGIPQPRYRFLMVFHKVHIDFPMPTTPIRDVSDILEIVYDDELGWVQRHDAWGYQPIHPGYHDLFRCLGPGEDLRSVAEDLDDHRRPPFMAHRLQLNGRGKTFTSAVMEVHPIYDRWVANSEVAALGGWPTEEKLYVGDVGEVRAQLTKAVMPPVGEYLGRCVRQALENERAPEHDGSEARLINHIEGKRYR